MWRIIEDWIEKEGIWFGLALIALPTFKDLLWGGLRDITLIRTCFGGVSIQLIGWLILLTGKILRWRYRK